MMNKNHQILLHLWTWVQLLEQKLEEEKKENIEEICFPWNSLCKTFWQFFVRCPMLTAQLLRTHSSWSAFHTLQWEEETSPSGWQLSQHWPSVKPHITPEYPSPQITGPQFQLRDTRQVEKLCSAASKDKRMPWVFWFKIYGYESDKSSEINVVCFSLLSKITSFQTAINVFRLYHLITARIV